MQTTKALYNRIAAYVNSTAGWTAANIQFVYYDFLFGDPAGESDNSQNECTTFAEDDHVFAELNQANENQTLISCLANKHTVIVYQGGLQYRPTPADYTKYAPYLYSMNLYQLLPAGPGDRHAQQRRLLRGQPGVGQGGHSPGQ